MITLALDTSTALGSVALLRDEKPLTEETFRRSVAASVPDASADAAGTAATTTDLFSAIHKLKPGHVDLYAVGIGPGSFTGIRAGIAAAKGLALPQERPIKAVSSFDALAMTALPKMPRDCPQICVLCDARRDEVYFAFYDSNGRRTRDCTIGALEMIADEIHNPVWFVSSEIEKFKPSIAEVFGGFATICATPVYPSAAALGWLAVRRFLADERRGDETIEPIYLRALDYKKL